MPRASRKKPIVRLIDRIAGLTTELRALPRADLLLVQVLLSLDPVEMSVTDLARLRAATDEFCETLGSTQVWSDQLLAVISGKAKTEWPEASTVPGPCQQESEL